MAFTIRNLSVLQYANGFTLWHYKSGNDNLADTSSGSYFNDASDMLMAGDMIMLSVKDGGRIVVVSSAKGENVSTAPLS